MFFEMFNFHFIFIFFYFSSFAFAELVYEAPEYPVAWPNLTIGGLFPLTSTNSSSVNAKGIEQLLASICTLDCFNHGKGGFPFAGRLNMVSFDGTELIYKSQAAAMKLLSYNLVKVGVGVDGLDDGRVDGKDDRKVNSNNSTNGPTTKDSSNDPSNKIAAIVASLSTLQYLAMEPIFKDFFFPVVGIEFLGYGIPLSQFPGAVRFKPRNVPAPFVVSTSATFALATAVVQLLSQLGWTLSTVLYGPDVFGMEGQAFLPSLFPAYNLTQACSTILVADRVQSELERVAECVKERQSRVIVYWSGDVGSGVTQQLQEQLDGSVIFIFPGKYALNNDFAPFPSSFIFDYPSVALPQQCFLECVSDGIPEKLPPNLVDSYWQSKFNCTYGTPGCPSSINDYEPFTASAAFDATSLIVKCVSLIQNDCELLTALMNKYSIEGRREDYCQVTTFTSTDINAILSLILYLGYGEFLNLGSTDEYFGTAHMSIALYQIQNDSALAAVGVFTTKLVLNQTALYWSTGSLPISEIPIVNPSFDYAVVVVFFSLAVVELLWSWLIVGALIAFRQEAEIRKSSPLIGFSIILGINLVLASLIFSSFTFTTWTCFVIAWSLLLGCGLIIGGMLAKSWRIYRIFTNPDARALRLNDSKIALITGSVLVMELVLLVLYSFPAGLLGPQVFQSTSDIYYRYRICTVPDAGYQLAWLIVIYTANGLIVLSLAWLSFLTRRVDSAFSEAKSTSLAIYTCTALLLIFLPLLYTSQNSTNSILTQYAVMAIVVLCSTACLLGVIFMPRIWPITARRMHET